METIWIELSKETLPTPNRLLWIKRVNGAIYFGSRKDKPFVENKDLSRDCYWYANPVIDNLMTDDRGDWHPSCHFQDGTVTHYSYVSL